MKTSNLIILGLITFIFIVLLWILFSNRNIVPYNEGLTSAEYPKTLGTGIYQVYDNIYFDELNGSLIEIDVSLVASAPAPAPADELAPSGDLAPSDAPSPAPAPAPEDQYGITVNNVYSRDKGNRIASEHYSVNNETSTILSASSSTDSISSAYDAFTVSSGKLQFFYVPWDKATLIHVIDLTINQTQPTPVHICTFIHDKASGLSNPITKTYETPINKISINTQSYIVNIADNRNTVIPVYDNNKSVRRIVEGVFYDMTNGSLITQTTNGFNVYERTASSTCQAPAPKYIDADKDPVSGTSSAIVDIGVCSWIVVAKQFIVLYVANGKRTQIVVLNRETNAEKYSIVNTTRFMNNGTVDTGSTVPDRGDVNITNEMDTDIYFILQNEYRGRGRGHHHKHDENPLSEYYKWADYWNKLSGSDLYSNITNSNYLLKTQVVPPVCPRCPNCPGSGVCTSCGGNGGSGTAGAPSKQEEDKKEESVGQFLKDSGSGVKDFAEDTGSGIKDFAEDTGKGLKTVAYDAASGAKGVAYDVAGGVKDVAYDVAGGVKDVAGGILGGVQRILTPHPSQVSGPNLGSGVGQHLNQNMGGSPHSQQFGIVTKTPQTTGSDFMSYFGALQPHGGSGNYVPVTADFSSFRR